MSVSFGEEWVEGVKKKKERSARVFCLVEISIWIPPLQTCERDLKGSHLFISHPIIVRERKEAKQHRKSLEISDRAFCMLFNSSPKHVDINNHGCKG